MTLARNPQQTTRKATDFIRGQLANQYPKQQSRPRLDMQKIERVIEEYCRDPDGSWQVELPTGFRRWPVALVRRRIDEAQREFESEKRTAQQVEGALRKFRDALFEKGESTASSRREGERSRPRGDLQSVFPFSRMFDELADINLDYWIEIAKIMQKRPKKGWPRDPDTPARYHAALAAVHLFRIHQLKCSASHSLDNKLLQLAKIIFGPRSKTRTTDQETDEGWSQLLRRAINSTTRTGPRN